MRIISVELISESKVLVHILPIESSSISYSFIREEIPVDPGLIGYYECEWFVAETQDKELNMKKEEMLALSVEQFEVMYLDYIGEEATVIDSCAISSPRPEIELPGAFEDFFKGLEQ